MNIYKVLTFILVFLTLFMVLMNMGIIMLTRIHGWSMYPTINDGDIILCVKMPTYNVGDIVVYKPRWAQGILVAHRIVYIEGDFYYMKGDNTFTNPIVDYYPATYSDIICKVVWWS